MLPLSMMVLALAQAAAPSLEVRVLDTWHPWPTLGPGARAERAAALDGAILWSDSAPGVRVGEFLVRTVGTTLRHSIAVVEIDPAVVRFALAARPGWERSTIDDWLDDSSVVLVANTGQFRDTGVPLGLVVLDGARRRPEMLRFDAVVAVEDGRVRLTGPAPGAGPTTSAFQTVPWLVREGRVVFGTLGARRLSRTHRDRRLSLCLGGDGRVRLLLSNFEAFGTAFGRIPIGLTIPEQAAIAAGIGCRDAVGLDGGLSAQIAVRTTTHLVTMPGWRRVPLMLLGHRP